MSVKLDIGAGENPLEGYTPIDRKNGSEAYPLKDYADDSVDAIRASHILEHFSFAEVPKVVQEWYRVLKPGAKLEIAVPDFDWIVNNKDDPQQPFYLFGSQKDTDDFHRSMFTAKLLEDLLTDVGCEDVTEWKGEAGATCAKPVSLNRSGVKPMNGKAELAPAEPVAAPMIAIPQNQVKIVAVLSMPRYGPNDAWGCIVDALSPWKIPVRRYTGAYWGQCMQNLLEQCVEDGLDMILTLDYDTMFTAKHFDTLLGSMCRDASIDAVAALQAHRGKPQPLMAKEGTKEAQVCGKPIRVDSAHFGMTLLRVDALKEVPKPWFVGKPNKFGSWGPERLDPDVWFWHQWKGAGKTLFVNPSVRVGHLAEMVRVFNAKMEFEVLTVQEWRDRELDKTKLSREAD